MRGSYSGSRRKEKLHERFDVFFTVTGRNSYDQIWLHFFV